MYMKLCARTLRLFAALALAPAAAFSAASSLGQSVAVNRLITPNGDNRNDTFVFRCYNPSDLAVEGKIYSMAGSEIASMRLKQRSDGLSPAVTASATGIYYDLEWDPNAGAKKPGGIYLYQVRAGNSVYKGTIAVIR